MIVKMSKYTFVLYHERQKEFLAALQELGLVDITTTGWEANGEELFRRTRQRGGI